MGVVRKQTDMKQGLQQWEMDLSENQLHMELVPYVFLHYLKKMQLFQAFNWRAGASQPSRLFDRNFLYIYVRPAVRTSCKCACAALFALLFIRNYYPRRACAARVL